MRFTKAFLFAARPHTLCVSTCSVVIAGAFAYHERVFNLSGFLLSSACLLILQAASNCLNDYCDFEKGVDREERVGFTRVMQSGLMTPIVMQQSILSLFFIAYLLSIPLILKSPILILLLISASLIGVFYSAGRRPLGHRALGELCVFMCFGPMAVEAVYISQAHTISYELLKYSLFPGFWSVFLMGINNYRDINSDRLAGKFTLAIYLGEDKMRLFCYCILFLIQVLALLLLPLSAAFFIPVMMYLGYRLLDKTRANQTLVIACQCSLLHCMLVAYFLLVS